VLGPCRDGADLGRVEQRIAHARGAAERDEPLDEFVVDRAVDQGARAGDACLSGCGEYARDDALHGVIEVGVLEDDVGGFAAELECHRFDRPRRKLINALAGAVTAGEGDLRDLRVRDEALADFRAETRHDIHHARRKPAFSNRWPNSKADTDENSDGFHTTVLPAASAGASFHVASINGEFHGVIAATTPNGSSRVKLIMPGLSMGMTRPSILSARPPK